MKLRSLIETPPGPIPRGLPSIELAETTTIRLISTAYIDEPAMRPLADDERDLDFLAEIEHLTSIRQDADIPLPSGVKRSELLNEAHGYGWTYANAAFCYTRPSGNRFNGSERGAWYAAWGHNACETAIEEVSYHLTRELDNVGVYDNITDYKELLASFIGPFIDLRNSSGADYLDPNVTIGHPAGQVLAREIRMAGGSGIVYPSIRRMGGMCLAAFRPNLIQNIRPGATWRLTWNGSRSPSITPA